jgi:hypothetical protein
MPAHPRFLALFCLLPLTLGCKQAARPPAVCFPGEMQCEPSMRLCDEKGDGWLAASCPSGQACVAGECGDPLACPDACMDVICQPGERFCLEDGVFVYECDKTGTKPLACGSCAAAPIGGVCHDGECVSLCTSDEKSYLGCEYFAVDLDNARLFAGLDEFGTEQFLDAQNAQYAVIVSNPDASEPAFVSITRGPTRASPPGLVCTTAQPDDSVVMSAIVPPRGLHVFELPSRNVDGTVLARLAYRIAANRPITAYQFNPLENVKVFSNDASLLLPTNTLDTDYFVMTRSQTFDELKGYLTVVGTRPGATEVTVRVTGRTLAGVGIPALEPGESFTARLSQYDVLNIETNFIGADLTGSTVHASQPVAVFGGSEAANAPTTSRCNPATHKCEYDGVTDCSCPAGDPLCSPDAKCSAFITCCADHLEKQLFPVSTWGSDYVAVRSYPRGLEKDIWRLLAAYDDTEVTLEPAAAIVPRLDAGQWFEFESAADFAIHATRPVLVGQFLAAQDAPNPGREAGDAGIGDPSFILLAPVRQFREDYVFLAPNKYAEDYVSVAARAGGTVRLDGTVIEQIALAQAVSIGTSGWRALRVPLADGFHEIICRGGCSIMVHGYDRYVSYAYPGGLNLEPAE